MFGADVIIPLAETPHYFYRHYFLTSIFITFSSSIFALRLQEKKTSYGLWHRQNQTENPTFHNLCVRRR